MTEVASVDFGRVRKAVVLRCDAGARHGLGHLSRCLTLASVLRKAGMAPRFVINAPPQLRSWVAAEGYTVVSVCHDIGQDAPHEWITSDVRFAVLDSKEVREGYVCACRALCPVACFDDEVARDLPCTVLINNNVWAHAEDYPPNPARTLLIGPAFNTVNPAYFELAGQHRRGLLISLGGEDPHNHTAWLINTLALRIGDLPTHVCIGPAHPDPQSVIRTCNQALPSAIIHRAPPTLTELMSQCHIALSAGGTTCYELAAAGIAMAILAVEDHQCLLQHCMHVSGVALTLGRFDTVTEVKTRDAFDALVDPRVRQSLVNAGGQLFASPGADEIVARLSEVFAIINNGTHH